MQLKDFLQRQLKIYACHRYEDTGLKVICYFKENKEGREIDNFVIEKIEENRFDWFLKTEKVNSYELAEIYNDWVEYDISGLMHPCDISFEDRKFKCSYCGSMVEKDRLGYNKGDLICKYCFNGKIPVGKSLDQFDIKYHVNICFNIFESKIFKWLKDNKVKIVLKQENETES